MNNVRYAKLAATDEEVYEACKAASIHEQILTFTDGKFWDRGRAYNRLTLDRLSNQSR